MRGVQKYIHHFGCAINVITLKFWLLLIKQASNTVCILMKASRQGRKRMHVNSFGSQDAPHEVGCENVNSVQSWNRKVFHFLSLHNHYFSICVVLWFGDFTITLNGKAL